MLTAFAEVSIHSQRRIRTFDWLAWVLAPVGDEHDCADSWLARERSSSIRVAWKDIAD